MSSDDIKSSAQAWGGDNPTASSSSNNVQVLRPTPSAQDTPPSYENATEPPRPTQPRLNPIQELSILASVPFTRYNIPDSTLSEDRVTNKTTHQLFYTKHEALHHLISEQAALPPMPNLQITGTHRDANHDLKTDFDLTLNLTTLLDLSNADSTSSGPRLRIKPPPNDRPTSARRLLKRTSSHTTPPTDLQLWTQAFCADKSENKSFELTRFLLDFPTSAIEGLVRTLIASTNYRGKLVVDFPVQHASVVIHKNPQNWFYNMLRLYPEKKYEAVEALWDVRGGGGGDEVRVAQEWWKEWEGPVRNAVLLGRRGRCGVEDWMEWKMGIRAKDKGRDWGVEGGSDWWAENTKLGRQ